MRATEHLVCAIGTVFNIRRVDLNLLPVFAAGGAR